MSAALSGPRASQGEGRSAERQAAASKGEISQGGERGRRRGVEGEEEKRRRGGGGREGTQVVWVN